MKVFPFLLSMRSIVGRDGNWPPEAAVVTKPSPPKGDGVFSNECIVAGAFVCRYHGQLLTIEDEEQRYPERYPDYCLQISPTLSIDGEHSCHWSRFINHNERGNLQLHTNENDGIAYFTAARDIAVGEELAFDYGVAYFIFRGITPAPGTESRSLELPQENMATAKAHAASSYTPKNQQDIRRIVLDSNESIDTKKATLVRGLDYYAGVTWMDDGDTVVIPTKLDGTTTRMYSYAQVSLDELAKLLGSLADEALQQP